MSEKTWDSWEDAFNEYWEGDENDLRGLICIDAAKDLFRAAFRMGIGFYIFNQTQALMQRVDRQERGPAQIRETQERED